MASIDDELTQIERDLRTLKIEYEQFFGGGRKRPPADTQWRLETMLKRHAERVGDLNYSQRFRYNNLTQTYAKYQDMWRKKVVQRETGAEQRHFGAAAKAIAAERARVGSARGEAEGSAGPGEHERSKAGRDALFKITFVNLDARNSEAAQPSVAEKSKVEQLYRKMVELRKETGERARPPSLEELEQFVAKKTQELHKKGAHQVEYTLGIEKGRVKLKARISS